MATIHHLLTLEHLATAGTGIGPPTGSTYLLARDVVRDALRLLRPGTGRYRRR
ncbi:hypothetical protein [Streptomyces agglomeratus]|uniref:hypothetical protein n=1 Tax=Streptomyces agglomeratus TaxID=285458 RepID=UPI00159F2C1D|nr:hypothetical protein [Streptomyces agglomeratus]